MLVFPATDMKKILTENFRIIYNPETGRGLEAFDVWRFLIEVRAAVGKKEGEAAKEATIQTYLDRARGKVITVRDSAIVRGFLDTFTLSRIEKIPEKLGMLWRVGRLLFILTGMSYAAGIAALVVLRQAFNFLVTGTFLSYSALFAKPFAIVNMVQNFMATGLASVSVVAVLVIIASRVILAKYGESRRPETPETKGLSVAIKVLDYSAVFLVPALVVAFNPLVLTAKFLAQTLFGGMMLLSIAIFTGKFVFYAVGKYAKLYPDQQMVKPYHYIRYGVGILAPVSVLVFTSLFNATMGWFGALMGLVFTLEFFRSALMMAVILVARNRFKAIAEDDKLYDGPVKAERERSFEGFADTVLGKYTLGELKLIAQMSDEMHRPDSVKVRMDDFEKKQYEKLVGKGAIPSDAAYSGYAATNTREEMGEIIGNIYEELTTGQLLERMSGRGFNELKEYLQINDESLKLWHVQEEFGLLAEKAGKAVDADDIRRFLDSNMNEKTIVMFYDFIPKFTPWIVVVLVGSDEVKVLDNLLGALLGYRYPLRRMKFIFAGENWNTDVQDYVAKKQKSKEFPENVINSAMTIR